jgi:sugar phosphate isomerase/epimerase
MLNKSNLLYYVGGEMDLIMKTKLGINCGFAINRYMEPEVWGKIVGEELNLRSAQFVADLLNPFLPEYYVESYIDRVLKVKEQYNFSIDSIFTSAYTRINHLMHPDKEARKIWIQWFKNFFAIGARLGAKSGGSHFGIMTFDTYDDEAKRAYILEEGIKGWQEISFAAKDMGYECLIFEPMSVPREMGNTVEESLYLMNRVNENCGVPMRICLDVGHAPHPDERDPYPWLEKLGQYSPIIHLQQTVLNKSNHWPFTEEYNNVGIIHGEKVLAALEKSGCKETLLMFEIGHREHWDSDFKVIEETKASVDYWRQFVKD